VPGGPRLPEEVPGVSRLPGRAHGTAG